MKSINTLFVIATFLVAGSAAQSQTADVAGVTTGTAATAASINALAAAINALNGRVDALEETPANVTQADLAGTTYCISYFGGLGGINLSGDFARIGSYVGSGKFSFSSSAVGSLTIQLDREFELGWFLGTTSPDTSISAYDWVDGPVPAGETADGPGPFDVAVNSLTDGVLSVTIGGVGGNVERFNISPDGNMLLSSNFSSDSGEGETNLIIGMRCI